MSKKSNTEPSNRIIDANLNRLKEGLRVCEEIVRFILNSHSLTAEFKRIRHKIDGISNGLPSKRLLVRERDSSNDIGKGIYINELKRKDYRDIFFANIQRAKESVRVLEEFSKLFNKNIAVGFKKIRYHLYEIEKKSAQRIPLLHNHR